MKEKGAGTERPDRDITSSIVVQQSTTKKNEDEKESEKG